MYKKEYRPRFVDKMVEDYLETFGAVVIEGPKWCGKTWTSSMHSRSEFLLGDPSGNFQNKHLAEISPATVLTGATPRLLDEWQSVPGLWDAVRAEVDTRNAKGQFILTGSATPQRKGIMHSGAGRIGRIRMRPMTLFEAGHSSGMFSLQKICQGELVPGEPIDLKVSLDSLDLKFSQLDQIQKADIAITNLQTKETEKFTFTRKDGILTATVPSKAVKTTLHFDVLALIIIFGLTMVASQKAMMSMTKNQQMDPSQEAMQKSMNMFMPIMLCGTFVFIPIPAGVLLYLISSNIVQIIQTLAINKQLELEDAKKKAAIDEDDVANAKQIKAKE